MKDLPTIAVFFDVDNISSRYAKAILDEVASEGRIVVKRAYGNWTKVNLTSWLDVLEELAIRPYQQTDYVSGKNASDMALTIDAMDCLYQDKFDIFVVVSSDSDFTPLAMRLHESGATVIGVGNGTTKKSLRNACDRFILLDNLHPAEPEAEQKETFPATKPPLQAPSPEELNNLHSMLEKAWEMYQDDDDICNVCSANSYLRRVQPDFDPRSYGAKSLPALIEKFPQRYEISRRPGKGTVTIVGYRCLTRKA